MEKLIKQAFLRAIEIAKGGAHHAPPNPLVGAVLLSPTGEILSEGYHKIFGGPHAEVEALSSFLANSSELSSQSATQQRKPLPIKPLPIKPLPTRPLSKLPKGCTVVVTLEPCSHHGKTPPCVDLLLQFPEIESVWVGLKDPNPLVSGRGLAALRSAGKRVHLITDEHPEEDELIEGLCNLAEIFLKNQVTKSAFVALKLATTLDGKLARSDGASRWITGELARLMVHDLRGRYRAILVGQGTLEKDDPMLDIRSGPKAGVLQPLVLVSNDPKLWVGLDAKRAIRTRLDAGVAVHIAGPIGGTEACPSWAQFLPLPFCTNTNGLLDLRPLGSLLLKTGLESVFVEGGGLVASEFLRQGLVDRFYHFTSGFFMGRSGLGFADTLELEREVAHGGHLVRHLDARVTEFQVFENKDVLINWRLHDLNVFSKN